MNEITEKEQLLRNKATVLEIRIKNDTDSLHEILREIQKLEKERGLHQKVQQQFASFYSMP